MDDLTRIHFPLPNHRVSGGESLWAAPIGGDLYELRNYPFLAYGVNFEDVIRAVVTGRGKAPTALEVVRSSGNRTLRLVFATPSSPDQRAAFLDLLEEREVGYEGANSRFFALNVPPHVSYDAITGLLEEHQARGLLSYETCEARVEGSFDDLPEEDRGEET